MASGYKLMDSFRSQVAKMKISGIANRAEFDVGYPTGFLHLDHLNGCVIHVETPEIQTSYNSIGILDGSANTFIGRSGCGKSTFLTQVAGNIIRPFDKAMLYIDDIEKSLPEYRKEVLIGFSRDEFEKRVDIRNTGITTENVYARIKLLRDMKLENRDEFEYDTGFYDTNGNRIFKLQPTVYMIDSVALLMPEDVTEEDELGSNMGGAQSAKKNSELVKKICQFCKEANIILLCVNHILDDIQINPFAKKQQQVAGLKDGERLPGGKAAIYLANNMFRMDDAKTLKATEGLGIDGTQVDVTIIKSRTNRTRVSVPLIFNKTEGCFDNDLSLYTFIKDAGRIGGAGSHMYIDILPEVKFAQKNFKRDLYENPELQVAFATACREEMSKLLSDMKVERYEKKMNINDLILGKIA